MSDNKFDFSSMLPDISKQLQKIVYAIIEQQNNAYRRIIDNALSDVNNLLKKMAEMLVPNIDASLITDSMLRPMRKLVETIEKFDFKDSYMLCSDDKQEAISDEIENIVFEIPIKEEQKEKIISCDEYKILKKKDPWTRADKIALASFLVAILTLFYSIISSMKDQNSELDTYNVNVNLYENQDNGDTGDEIRLPEKIIEIIESIITTNELNESNENTDSNNEQSSSCEETEN